MTIKKEQTAAVLIDVQERLFPHIHEHKNLEHNLLRFIKGLNVLEVPLLITQQYTKGIGQTIPSLANAIDPFSPIEKMSFSCCGAKPFMDKLTELDPNFILLFGIETHVCVLQTALQLLDDGYQPVIAEDCVSSRKANDKFIAIERMRQAGCVITTYESVLFELTQVAGTETFKNISKIIK
ncbi:MAG: isochorismatase family protein [Caldithrix sp.]|nr:isochorismatase family protein [Caldithrix sp.]